MANIEFVVPAMGEGIIEVTITRWFAKEGDWVEEDDPLLEVATDKVDSEVPAPVTGKISKILFQEGEVPQIGDVLAIIASEAGGEEEEELSPPRANGKVKIPIAQEQNRFLKKPVSIVNSDINITPYISFLAKDRGIHRYELEVLSTNLPGGKITRRDLNAYIHNGRPYRQHGSVHESEREPLNTDRFTYIPGDSDQVVEMDRTRRLIAEHMVQSKKISPHVTSNIEIDVTSLVKWRDAHKERFLNLEGIKLTYTPFVVEAVVMALKEYPGINISVVGNSVVYKKDINIGVATALPDGNLIVPVIKQADQHNWISFAHQVNDLAGRARKSELKGHEVHGGTFTITNMGQFNNVFGTPIINQPEAAILAVGAIQKKPGVVMVDGLASVGVRDLLILSLTYDHRAIDGALGGSFLNAIGKHLETMAEGMSL